MKLDGHEDPSIHDGCRFVSSCVVSVQCECMQLTSLGYVEFRRITLVPDESPTLKDLTRI